MLKFFGAAKKSAVDSADNDIRRREELAEAEYATFLESPAVAGLRPVLECPNSPPSARGGLECAVTQTFAEGDGTLAAPSRLVARLLQRLGTGCVTLDGRELAEFLRNSLQCLLAVVAAAPERSGVGMLERGLDDHLLAVLSFVRSRLLSRTLGASDKRRDAMPMGSISEPANTSTTTTSLSSTPTSTAAAAATTGAMETQGTTGVLRGAVMDVLRNATRLLLAVHVPGTSGCSPLTTRSASYWGMSETVSYSTVATREAIVAECGHLFLYCSKGTLDLDLPAAAEREAVAEVICGLALLMTTLCQEIGEQVVHVTLAGAGVQLARFLVVTGREETDLLLRQLSCSLLLVTRTLREKPLLTIQAMNSVYFFDNLAAALQIIGAHYNCDTEHESYTLAKAEAEEQLRAMSDLESFRVTTFLTECPLTLPRPRFERLAESESADEFLHCYLALLEAQRVAKVRPDVTRDAVLLWQISEVELTLMKAFLGSPCNFPSSSCMYDTLVKFAISVLPLSNTNRSDRNRLHALRPLVHAGLYRMLLHDSAFTVFRRDPRLRYAAVYVLHYMLTCPVISLDASTASASGAVVNAMEEEVSSIFDALIASPTEAAPLCAVLSSAVRGPHADAIVSAILQCRGISTLAAMASRDTNNADMISGWVVHLLTQLFRHPVVQSGVLSSDPSVVFALLSLPSARCEAESMLVALLTHRCAEAEYPTRMTALSRSLWESISHCVQPDEMTSMAPAKADAMLIAILRCIRDALQVLISPYIDSARRWGPARQLQYALCGDTNSAPDGFLQLIHRMALPWHGTNPSYGVACILHTITFMVRGNPTMRSSLFQTVGAEQLVECMRGAWFSTRGESWMHFVRTILVLVYEEDSELDDVERKNSEMTIKKVKTTTTPAAAAVVVVGAAETSTKLVTLGDEEEDDEDNKVNTLLGKVWDETSLSHGPTSRAEMERNDKEETEESERSDKEERVRMSKNKRNGQGSSTRLKSNIEDNDSSNVNKKLLEDIEAEKVDIDLKKKQPIDGQEGIQKEDVIQNAELLVPLLNIFAKLPRFREKHRDALEYILTRVIHTLKASRASLWMVANAGLFASLTALIPVVTETALLETVLGLIMTIASHHISVRETKQFLMTIAHAESEETRRQFVPIVIEFLNVASYVFLNRQAERQNYIAFREHSGPTGVKAVLHDFPPDGYTICMWIRLERSVDPRLPQCIFSLQGVEKKTLLELFVATNNSISIAFQDAQRRHIVLDLGSTIRLCTWVHLAVVHRQSSFPFGGSELQLFLNGVDVTNVVRMVYYPPLLRGFLFIGIRGEDVEQRSYGNAFTGQMTAVYFFSRPLPARDVTDVFLGGNTAGAAPAPRVPTVLTSNASSMGSDSGGGRNYAEFAAVYIDPRFGERGQLHNLAALLRGKPAERPLITYEGTLACNTTSIIDSICVVGALQTVVVPLLVMLVNPQLPFRTPPRRIIGATTTTTTTNESSSSSSSSSSVETIRKALDDLLKLVESLLLYNVVRADVLEVGLFPMIAYVLQQLGGGGVNIPQRLCNLCTALLPNDSMVDAAYSALFLSGDLLRACDTETRLMLIRIQTAACTTRPELRARVRGLDLPGFLASEIIDVYIDDTAHHRCMRAEMFYLMETVMEDPVTMNDAETVHRLVAFAAVQKSTTVRVEVLSRCRTLVATRGPQLAAYMGRRHFAANLIPLLSSEDAGGRNEALLLLCLLVSRSRRTQELLNPTLLSTREAVHVECDVSLAWLRDKLHAAPIDDALYATLRAALIGRFDAPLPQGTYTIEPIGREEKILFAPALTPLLQLIKRSQDVRMKMHAMADLATLAQQDPSAWKEIVSVRGWYASVVDLYLSEEGLRSRHSSEMHQLYNVEVHPGKESVEEIKIGEKGKENSEDDPLLTHAAIIFARVLTHALMQETYGASELELFIAYVVQQGAHHLLNATLVGVLKEYTTIFAMRGRDAMLASGGNYPGLGSQTATSNLIALLGEVEDLLFYSLTVYPSYGVVNRSTADLQRRRGYTEDEELVLQPDVSLEVTVSAIEEQSARRAKAPDGMWLHTKLAIQTMEFITVNSAVLNAGSGGGGGGGGVSVVGGVSGVTSAPAEFYTRGHRMRKGGFLRLFVRLFRVVCDFTLRDAAQLDSILLLTTRFVQLIEKEQGAFALLRRPATEFKEHSPISSTMIVALSLNQLLTRRLRYSVLGSSVYFGDVNCELLDRIKCLCILQKRTLSLMQIFSTDAPSRESRQRIQLGTLEWLCRRSREDTIADFVEVASRQDYDSFMFQCTLAMERDQITEKAMARAIEQEHATIVVRLHQTITNLSVARKSILEALEIYLQQVTNEVQDGVALSAERYNPRAARRLAMVVFHGAWTRFLDRCKGTIWDLDPAGQHSTHYVRLLEVEQRHLVHRKFIFDCNGTDHSNITKLGSAAIPLPPAPRLRLHGGEKVLLSTGEDSEVDEEVSVSATTPPLTPEFKEQDDSAVVFAAPCEVPYMMHCWSATLMIKGMDLCVFFDDDNTAYNQRIAEDAESLLVKPRSIIYPFHFIALVAPGRRFRMRRSAIELWFRDGRSVLMNFSTIPEMREAVSNIRTAVERQKPAHLPFNVLHENPKKEVLLARCTEQWREREMSNFEYLLWLNFFASRTLNDLTQYPIFPWIIANYKSESLDLEQASTFRDLTLPVGICGDASRRHRVEARYEETKQLGDVPAHYFTHYSSPAVTLYFMVRVEPYTTLQIILQGGHFDHADRMFHSLASSWQGVTTNNQDVRELIPELYYLPEICMNKNRVDFGEKQDGVAMDSLELPPWANGDPYEFVYHMREALETDHVSSMLHHWIDLIFGYKQRGKEAIDALNVFNWHSYEDLDKSRGSDVDQKLLIDSLDNIGQTPIQLFTRHHGERRSQDLIDPVTMSGYSFSVKSVDIRRMCARVARVAVLHSDRVIAVSGSGATLLFRLTVTPITRRTKRGADGASTTSQTSTTTTATTTTTGVSTVAGGFSVTVAKSASRGQSSFDMLDESERRAAPLPPGVVPSTTNKAGGPCESDNVAVLYLDGEVFIAIGGLFDNTFVIRRLTSSFGEVRLSAHRGRVVCIAASPDGQFVVTGAEDTTFIVWSCRAHHGKLHVDLLFTVYGHEDNPTAVDVNPALDLVVTASRDGVLMLHSLRSSRLERSMRHPERYAIDRVLIQPACYVPNVLFVSNTDGVIHQISINGGAPLRFLATPGRITSWCMTPRQYLLVTTAPLTKSNASEGCGGTVLFVHSFFLSILRSVPCPPLSVDSTISSCAIHPWNPQVIVCGSTEGSLLLLRVE